MKTRPISFDADRVLRDLFSEEMTRAIDAYLDDTPLQLEAMSAAIERQDRDLLGRAARSLRSSSARVGACSVARMAADLESLVHGKAVATLPIALFRVHAAFTSMAPQLRAYLLQKEHLQQALG